MWNMNGSMINHTGRRGNYKGKRKIAAIENMGHIDLYFICIDWEHMYIYVQNIKFLWLACGQHCPQTTLETRCRMPDDSDTRTIHDCVGSLACMPNEPIRFKLIWNCAYSKDNLQKQEHFAETWTSTNLGSEPVFVLGTNIKLVCFI